MLYVISFIMFAGYAAAVFYVGYSLWRLFKPKQKQKQKHNITQHYFFVIAYTVVITVAASSWFIGMFWENVVLNMIGAYWLAVLYLLIILLPLAHIVIWLLRLTKRSNDRLEKRVGFVLLIAFLSLICWGTYNAYSPVVHQYEITINKAGQASPLHIAMAADMHFGLLSNKYHAQRLVNELNALQPDLILFPGDLFDDEYDSFVKQNLGEILRGIVKPRCGVFAALGNHDNYRGSASDMIAILEQSNIQVLSDEVIELEDELVIIGRKDATVSDRAALDTLMDTVDLNKPILLLDHQPLGLEAAQKLGVDMMLSGHTHRGQIFPGMLITDKLFTNDWGHLQIEQFHSIVTSGFGFWGPPLRIGTRSEIIHLIVHFGSTSIDASDYP